MADVKVFSTEEVLLLSFWNPYVPSQMIAIRSAMKHSLNIIKMIFYK